jgi:hypothetical protein
VQPEETVVDGGVGKARVQCDERRSILWPDGPQVRGAAVGQHHVGLPLGGMAPITYHWAERTSLLRRAAIAGRTALDTHVLGALDAKVRQPAAG